MLQRWRSHHSIPYSQKSHAALKHHEFYKIGVISKFHIARIWTFDNFFSPVTLTLTRWPSYTNLTRISWRYTRYSRMNFLRQSLRELSYYWHTYIQTDKQTDTTEIIYHAASPRWWSKWDMKIPGCPVCQTPPWSRCWGVWTPWHPQVDGFP